MCASTLNCPICEKGIEGDEAALQQHVNNHLDEKEDELSRKLAEELDVTDEPRPEANGHADFDYARFELNEVEKNDAALAAALAGGDSSYNGRSSTFRGSLSDSVEQLYPDVLRRILPYYDDPLRLPRKNTHVCSKVDLYCSNIAGLGWDCGYRNIQMMFSALLYEPSQAEILKRSDIMEVPSIPEIASRIEEAWRKGYDPEGAASFGRSLTDKEVWIGATEFFVLFKSLELDMIINDFETPNEAAKAAMFEWIHGYFDSLCRSRSCAFHEYETWRAPDVFVPPMFCQWQGHSITIVGAERSRSGQVTLIVLDPSRGYYMSLVASNGAGSSSTFRRGLTHHQMAHPRFQIVTLARPRASADAISTVSANSRTTSGRIKNILSRFKLKPSRNGTQD